MKNFAVPRCRVSISVLREGCGDLLNGLLFHPGGCVLPVGDPCPRWRSIRAKKFSVVWRVAGAAPSFYQDLDGFREGPFADEVHCFVGFPLSSQVIQVRRARFSGFLVGGTFEDRISSAFLQ